MTKPQTTYYNEFDAKKCAALRELQKANHISTGTIDERSIKDVKLDDIQDFKRAHFFAGIGLWDYALDLAGWPEDIPVWTGSCPCQPYSTAGRQKAQADDRHLWPEWFRLIKECRPPVIFGEQVANAITYGWLDDVYQGLEAEGYAVGSAVLPACSVGAPHRRDRLWFVAYLQSKQRDERRCGNGTSECGREGVQGAARASGSTMGDAERTGLQRNERQTKHLKKNKRRKTCAHGAAPEPSYDLWQNAEWIDCADGKKRYIEPGICLLADGYPERVGLLHSAGDAIVPQVAATFIESAKETIIKG